LTTLLLSGNVDNSPTTNPPIHHPSSYLSHLIAPEALGAATAVPEKRPAKLITPKQGQVADLPAAEPPASMIWRA
jgi:hypothetical protein